MHESEETSQHKSVRIQSKTNSFLKKCALSITFIYLYLKIMFAIFYISPKESPWTL